MSYQRLLALLLAASLASACVADETLGENEGFDSGDELGIDVGVDARSDVGVDAGDVASVNVDMGRVLPERPWSVKESGPYNVGYTHWDLTYDAVGEPNRTLRVAAWYPTWDEEGEDARYGDILNQYGVWEGASLAISEKAPLLVFSHGNGGMAEQSYYLTEFFASHGWIVVSPDHTGNTFRSTSGINLSSAPKRPQDISAVLDDMYNLPDEHFLRDMVTDDVVMAGHSFGGYTTLASAGADFQVDELLAMCDRDEIEQTLCDQFENEFVDLFREGFHDSRIDVAIPQTPAGADVFGKGLADIEIPTLLMTGEQDRTLPNAEEGDPIWWQMDSPSARINLTNGGHFTFSNMCDWFAGFVPDDGCDMTFIEPELAYEIINAYTMAFVRYHLFDDQSVADLVTGAQQPWSDEVEFSRK